MDLFAFDPDTVGVLVRNTARVSFVLFLAGFVALTAQRGLLGWAATGLAGRRKAALRALPVLHLVHYGCVLWLGALTDFANLRAGEDGTTDWTAIGVGMIALGIMTALALTTWPGAAAACLHRGKVESWGMFALWFFFAAAYTPRAFSEPFYLPFALAAWGALAIRLVYREQR